jgi:hypothetical protein
VTPLGAPLVVNSGTRRVQVRHPAHAPQSRAVSLAGGEQQRAVFTLAPPARRERLAAVPAPEPPSPRTASNTGATALHDTGNSGLWLGWTITGALAAGAVATGLVALSKDDDLEQRREQRVADKAELDDDAKTVRTLAIVSDSLGVAALVAGGVTLWLTLSSNDAEGRRVTTTADTGAVRQLRFGVGPTGAVLRGSF